MSKAGKTILIILSIAVVLVFGAFLFVGALWNGTFNFLLPKEIATYQSPDGEYSLVFEQMGDPAWPFGPTDVRLTLKNNIASISWNDDEVVVVLRASEMKDKEVVMEYKGS